MLFMLALRRGSRQVSVVYVLTWTTSFAARRAIKSPPVTRITPCFGQVVLAIQLYLKHWTAILMHKSGATLEE
jgi:hypothetical protein